MKTRERGCWRTSRRFFWSKFLSENSSLPHSTQTLLKSKMKQQVSRPDFTDCGRRSVSTWILAGSGTPDQPERPGSTRANTTSAGYTNQRDTASCFHANSTSDIIRLQLYQDGDSPSLQASTQTRKSTKGRLAAGAEGGWSQRSFNLSNIKPSINNFQSLLRSDPEASPSTYLRLRRVEGEAGQTAAESGWRTEQQQKHHPHIQPHLCVHQSPNQLEMASPFV